jgi:hypothetical protein
MFARTHTPLPLRTWVRHTAIRFVVYAVIPALIFAWVFVRLEMRSVRLDLGHTPTTVEHGTR